MANYWIDNKNKKRIITNISFEETFDIISNDLILFNFNNYLHYNKSISYGRDHRKNKCNSWIRRELKNKE